MLAAIRKSAQEIVFLSLVSLVGCSLASIPTTALLPTVTLPSSTPQPIATVSPQTFKDPFEYCSAVGNTDRPDAGYTGDKIPIVIVQSLRKALNAPVDAPNEIFLRATFWRCMNGKVYACFVGANLPCGSKANTDKTPTQAEKDYCDQNSRADIPAAVTGHETIYAWRCSSGLPEIIRQVFQTDARGFIAEIWYELKSN
jgi:hypothetical protein